MQPRFFILLFKHFPCRSVYSCMTRSNEKINFLAVLSVLLGLIMSVLDGSIVNVSLPVMTKELGISSELSIWIINGYLLVITMLVLVFASLGEIRGYRRVFLCGILAFTLASGMCALSRSFEMLVFSRVIQGIGAACMMSVSSALIRFIYPPKVLGRGLSLNAMVVAVSAAAGPTVAGVILSFASWHWLFAINLPIGLVACLIGWKHLPDNPVVEAKCRFDWMSALYNVLFFGLLIMSIDGFTSNKHPSVIAWLMVAALFIGVLYFKYQQKSLRPILPVDLLHIPVFSLSVGTSIASYAAQMLVMVSMPFLLHDTFGFSEVQTAAFITPWPLATLVSAPVAGRLIEKVSPGLLAGIGMIVLAIGFGTLYALPSHPTTFDIIWRMVVCGIGFGLFQTPNNVVIISSSPADRSGGASGMQSTARLLGQTLGTALVALIFHMVAYHQERVCVLLAIVFALLAGIFSFFRVGRK